MRQGYEVEALTKAYLEKYVLKLSGEVDELRFIAIKTAFKPSPEGTHPCSTIGLSHN